MSRTLLTPEQKQSLIDGIRAAHSLNPNRTNAELFKVGVSSAGITGKTFQSPFSSTVATWIRKALGTIEVEKPKSSAFQTILEAEKTIEKALRELDVERGQYMEKIKELDDTIAKYKRLTMHS